VCKTDIIVEVITGRVVAASAGASVGGREIREAPLIEDEFPAQPPSVPFSAPVMISVGEIRAGKGKWCVALFVRFLVVVEITSLSVFLAVNDRDAESALRCTISSIQPACAVAPTFGGFFRYFRGILFKIT